MTKEELKLRQEQFRKETEVAKFEAFSLMCQKVAELEKENAELKGLKDVATLIRANNDTVITLMQLNNMLVSKSQQLTKATEMIERLLKIISDFQMTSVLYDIDTLKEAELFLKGKNIILEDAQAGNSPKTMEWNFTHRNEQHLVVDCPKGEENKLYLLLLNSRDSKEFEFGRKVPVVCYWNEEWCRFERLEHTIGERNINQNDINAWKEIVLPKLPKENK